MRWAIVYNPVAGGFRAEAIPAIRAALHGEGIEARFFATGAAGQATEISRGLGGFDCIAAYGGDGTLNEVLNGLPRPDMPLAFLPGGTANVMAHELGLPFDPVRAAHCLARGGNLSVRPGVVQGRLFLLMAGFGFDGEVVRRVSPWLKARLGKLAYGWAGLKELAGSPASLMVHPTDAPRRQGVWVVAARGRHYGGGSRIHPRAGLTRDALGVTVVGRFGVLPFLAANLGLGLPWAAPLSAFGESPNFRVTAPAPVPVQVDGDFFCCGTAFEVGLAPHELRLRVPAQGVAGKRNTQRGA